VDAMKNSVKVGMITVLAILLSFYLSVAFAGNENINATKSVNMTNTTKNMTSMAQNITNETKNVTSVTMNLTNITIKPKNITNSTINVPMNTTNEGKKIESEVLQQVEEMQRDTKNVSNGNANEIKSALKDSSY
jgi:preprotein translocase subunit SecF